jgi:hypothetical protein
VSNLPPPNLPPPNPPGSPIPPGSPVPSAPPSTREAKADARAAKARAKALRPWYRKKRWWLTGVVVLVGGLAVATSGSDDGSTQTATSSEEDAAAGQSDGGQDVYAVGQSAHTGDFDVLLHTVEDPYVPSNEFERPSEGHRYVAVEVEVSNSSDEAQPMSTLLGAEVMDSASRAWNIALAGLDRPQLDGTVAAGESRRGWIVFEVAQDSTGLRLRLKGNLTATGSLFALS